MICISNAAAATDDDDDDYDNNDDDDDNIGHCAHTSESANVELESTQDLASCAP
jgi:hypothetical protein